MNISIKNENHKKLALILNCNVGDIFEAHPTSGLNFAWSVNMSGSRFFSSHPVEDCLDGIKINNFGRITPKTLEHYESE
jgi:hypothetical protein